MKTPKEKLKEIYDEYLKENQKRKNISLNNAPILTFWEYLEFVRYKDKTEHLPLLITSECGFSTTSECRKAINELENPILKEKRYGGGVRKCEKCGELVNGSKIHRCDKDYFASVRNNITESTKNSGYTVYIPESANKSEQQETWQNIFQLYNYNIGNLKNSTPQKLKDWLQDNFEVPKRK